MRKLIKVNNHVVTAPFMPIRSMREELDSKGATLLAAEAIGLFAFIGLSWASLFLINAYYGG
jgi:hypothetical protein